MARTHLRARGVNLQYLDGPLRAYVPCDKVSWDVPWPEYKPTQYTAPSVLAGPVWADPVDAAGLQFNSLDSKRIDRRSHDGPYTIVDGMPRNPVGRTGITGRGLLGRWGPNHAADPVVTRWLESPNGTRVLQFVGIKRRDTGEWALPGGMCDPGEAISRTLKREFSEEALNSLEASAERLRAIRAQVDALFEGGVQLYAGYVDDPRNVDNAWMETVAMHFHFEGDASWLVLEAGDDASHVQWISIEPGLALYASHADFIHQAAARIEALELAAMQESISAMRAALAGQA
eukprot:a10746_23.p1 GENE.a10746_23~~a10746_23.p1  ORF type:complete len:299 (-),score=53.70 a10746_23:31-897(-)